MTMIRTMQSEGESETPTTTSDFPGVPIFTKSGIPIGTDFAFGSVPEKRVPSAGPTGWVVLPISFPTRRPLPKGEKPGKSLVEVARWFEDTGGREALQTARRDLARLKERAGEPGDLKTLRLAAGLSQAELAVALKTSQSYVARLEMGQIRNPTARRVVQIAQTLGIDLQTVMDAING